MMDLTHAESLLKMALELIKDIPAKHGGLFNKANRHHFIELTDDYFMQRNQLTKVSQLKPGDRFYLARDKAKKPLQIVEGKAKRTAYQTYKHFYCPAAIIDNPLLSVKDHERNYQAIKPDTEVIFLRHQQTA